MTGESICQSPVLALRSSSASGRHTRLPPDWNPPPLATSQYTWGSELRVVAHALGGDRRRLGLVGLEQPAGAGIDLPLSVQGPVADFPKPRHQGLRVGDFGELPEPGDSAGLGRSFYQVATPYGLAGCLRLALSFRSGRNHIEKK